LSNADPPTGVWQSTLLRGAAEFGLAPTPEEMEAYRTHLELLLSHNRRAGLTSITDPAEIAIKHFLDSLTGLLLHDIAAGERVADLGSGGGFPGLVLAVARPHASYLLVERTKKRAAFLQEAAGALGLNHVEVLSARAEEAGRDPLRRETYHLVLGRAVAPLPVLLEYGLPLARVGGHLLAYKGPDVEPELARSQTALDALGGRLAATRSLSLPQQMGERVLVLVEKTAPTPPRYPRRPRLPPKRPL